MALIDKLTNIADAIRGKTGKTEELTLDQMATAIAGIETGGGGGSFPELIYETTFEVEEAKTSGSSVLCTISTGLAVEDKWITDGEMLSVVFELDSIADGYTPNDKDVMRCIQAIYLDQYASWAGNNSSALRFRNGTCLSNNQGCGIYCSARPQLFNPVTVNYRLPNGERVAPGIYTFKLYRTGVSLL